MPSLKLPILAIDTAAQQCGVALFGDGIACEIIEPGPQGQSQRILPLIQQILREAGVGFGDLKGVAVTTGPGSFTGLRIGLAAAHGIALARAIPAVGISSFRAFREAAPNDHRDYYVIIESRRAELYWQVFDDYSGPISDPTYNTAEEIAEMARDEKKEILILGDGCAHLRHFLPNYQFLDQSPGPSPLVVAQLGATDIIYSPPSGLPQPVYIRPADAKPAKA